MRNVALWIATQINRLAMAKVREFYPAFPSNLATDSATAYQEIRYKVYRIANAPHRVQNSHQCLRDFHCLNT